MNGFVYDEKKYCNLLSQCFRGNNRRANRVNQIV